MIKMLISAMIGCMVGIGTMCFMVVAGEEDKWLEKKAWERKHGRDTH